MRTTVILAALLTMLLFSLGCSTKNPDVPVASPNESNALTQAEITTGVDLALAAAANLPLIGENDRFVFTGDPVPVPGPNEVWLHGMEYRPGIITVPAGTTITWTNVDDTPHDVASVTGLFFIADLAQGTSFNYTFTEPGVFQYLCYCNPGMEGTVIVN